MYKVKQRADDNAVLDVIAVVSNPAQFSRRYELFNEFCARLATQKNVRLTTIELQQRARPFCTDAKIKVSSKHELWHKENLINVAVQQLPADWEYMAWVDADIIFQNESWALDTINQLQTYSIVQLFTHAVDLGPRGETLQVHTGFAYQFCQGTQYPKPGYPATFWHPGYAWAMRRGMYDALGGLMDFPILGSADHHMALAFIEKVSLSLNHRLHPNYKTLVTIFEERCKMHLKQNIGYVPGTILHCFHGNKADRRYQSRWAILVDNQFDPLRDIKKDSMGLWQLEDNKPALRDALRLYFRVRNEDAVDLNQSYTYVKRVS